MSDPSPAQKIGKEPGSRPGKEPGNKHKAREFRPASQGYFRSVDEWKSALMTLPDSNFYELLRSVIGNIKTPFNKQRLLNELFNFLSGNEVRKIISAYINEQDRMLIAAIALLREPAPGMLESFFSGELSYAELHALIINLEERLIVYRLRNEEGLCLALNPVLESILGPVIADTRILFPCHTAGSGPKRQGGRAPESGARRQKTGRPLAGRTADCVSDGRVLAALLSIIQGEEELLRAEGGIRKKVLETGKRLFPEMDIELAIRTLIMLGLVRQKGAGRPAARDEESWPPESRSLVPSRKKTGEFCKLEPGERQDYWAAGVYLCMNEGDQEFNNRTRVRKIAAYFHGFRALIDPDMRYPEITLRRILDLFTRQDAGAVNFFDPSPALRLSFASMLDAMEMTGILEREGAFWKARPLPNAGAEEGKPVIAQDAAFSLVLYPEIPLGEALALGTFCSVREIPGTKKEGSAFACCFELTRGSVIRGFDEGMGAEAIIKLLDRLSLDRIDANLKWTLNEWESRYAGISLHQGIILNLAEDRRYLAEARPVASLIRKTLAPGVYLLSSAERSEAARALRQAGIDIVAQPSIREDADWAGNSFPSTKSGSPFFPFVPSPESAPPLAGEPPAGVPPGAAIQEEFRRMLEKMRLSKHERDELSARIDRRLVLSDAQLEGASLRYEKLEAMGLDYAGKALIAKQALQSGFLVEVSWPGSDGETRKEIGLVQSLEKKEGESTLVLRPSGTDGEVGDTIRIPGDTIRIPLGKISLLRRIKQSIFGE